MRRTACVALVSVFALLLSLGAVATSAEMYFAVDKNGEQRVTHVQEGEEVWIVVIDNDQNLDCDVRDKMSPDLKIMDFKTGALSVWIFDPEAEDPTDYDYLEETGPDTGVFVSHRAFQIGTRESFAAATPNLHTHVVDRPDEGITDDFVWGHYWYGGPPNGYADNRGWIAPGPEYIGGLMIPFLWPGYGIEPSRWADGPAGLDEYIIGRFENMNTLIGMYADPNELTDVAIAMMKIIDTEATIAWRSEVVEDHHSAATITVIDPDENLNCNEVEYVPVFVIVNPGSWNSLHATEPSPTTFCTLMATGGVDATTATPAQLIWQRIRWYNIYNSANDDGRYYIQYPFDAPFDPVHEFGVTPVSFYAQETGANTGVFQLNFNDIARDLRFNSLNVRDVLVAYYLDPNDDDDFKLATSYIEEKQHSVTRFTNSARDDVDTYWIGRDSVYIQVLDANANVDPCSPEQVLVHLCDPHGEDDAEWLILDESSSNSPVFYTYAGTQLRPVWDGLGIGFADSTGGFWLRLDNWKLEVFNEDDLYARYNDVHYQAPTAVTSSGQDFNGLGDSDIDTAFPPSIGHARVHNDLSFGTVSIGDTQVFDGNSTNMRFLNRQGQPVEQYGASDCVFIEVIDPDQDEDIYRRERIDAYWDGGQNVPFGAQALNEFVCPTEEIDGHGHYVNILLGDTNIFNDGPATSLDGECWAEDWDGDHAAWPKLYILNPGSGGWAAVDLLETGPNTGTFVSVICVDLVSQYSCVPTLAVWPGDTLVAVYQDPSNHSDSAMISIQVGMGGGGMPPSQQSTTQFVDDAGHAVESYLDADAVYVKVIDTSHAGVTLLTDAVEIEGMTYDLLPLGTGGEFMTAPIDLDLQPGDELTATYTDPTNPLDTSSDTVGIVTSAFEVASFVVSPNPFEIDAAFSYNGTGVASTIALAIYDLSGALVQELSVTDATEIVWDGTKGARCSPVANGCYLYVITASNGASTFNQSGKVFVNR